MSMYRRPTLWTTPNWACSDSVSTVLTASCSRIGEFLEPGVCRGLQDHAVLRHQDAPRLFPVAVLPAVLLDHLDRGAVAGGEGYLVELAGSFYWEAGSAECILDGGGVAFHLADRAEAEVAEGEDEGLGGEGLVAAGSLHWGSLGLQVGLQLGGLRR